MTLGPAPKVEITPDMSVADLAVHVEANRLSLLFHVPEHLRQAVWDHIDGEVADWHFEPAPRKPRPNPRIEKWAARVVDDKATITAMRRDGLSFDEIAEVYDRWAEKTE